MQPFPFLAVYKSDNILNILDYSSTHKEIIEDCKRGDRKAQFELYQLYARAMYSVCLRMVKNETDAEDILQNAFVDIFTKLDSFRYQSAVGAWIKRIVVNNCINFLKKRRVYFDELDERHGNILFEETTKDSPKLDVGSIKRAVTQLPDGYRVVLSLYMFEGYDHGEIAEILNISEATSKSQYSRAKKKLRGFLDKREVEIH